MEESFMKIGKKEFQTVYVGASCEHMKEIDQRKYSYNFRLQTIKFRKPDSPFYLDIPQQAAHSLRSIKEHVTTWK